MARMGLCQSQRIVSAFSLIILHDCHYSHLVIIFILIDVNGRNANDVGENTEREEEENISLIVQSKFHFQKPVVV